MAALLLLLACEAAGTNYRLGWESVPCDLSPPQDNPGASWLTEFYVHGEPRPSVVWLAYGTTDLWQIGTARWDEAKGTITLSGSRADPLQDCLLWLAE